MMHAYEYDADVAVFITPDCDFAAIWTSLSTYLQQFGLRCIEHTQGFKYRVCLESPLAFNRGKPGLAKAGSGSNMQEGFISDKSERAAIGAHRGKLHRHRALQGTPRQTHHDQRDRGFAACPHESIPDSGSSLRATTSTRPCSNRAGAKPSVKCFIIFRWPLHGNSYLSKKEAVQSIGVKLS